MSPWPMKSEWDLRKPTIKGFWEILSLLLWTKWYTDVLLWASVTIALGWETVTQNNFDTQEGDQREQKNSEQDPWLNFPCGPPLQSSVKWTCKSSLFFVHLNPVSYSQKLISSHPHCHNCPLYGRYCVMQHKAGHMGEQSGWECRLCS